jgi:hypothetical protein
VTGIAEQRRLCPGYRPKINSKKKKEEEKKMDKNNKKNDIIEIDLEKCIV